MNTKKERIKPTPEQLFNVYQECNIPGSSVKVILERCGLKPWELAEIRKKVRFAAITALSSTGAPGRNIQTVPLQEYHKIEKQLDETKDALAAVGHELSLLKKRTN